MSDQTSNTGPMADHRMTYDGFIRGAIVIAVECFFILTALCNFAFGSTIPLVLGFGGIVIGAIALAIDARSGSKTFAMSLILLLAYMIITAVNVS